MAKKENIKRELIIKFWLADNYVLAKQVVKMKGFEKYLDDDNDEENSEELGFIHPYSDDIETMEDDFIVLRTSDEEYWSSVYYRQFETDSERNEYLQKIYSAITSELFGDVYDGKPRFGDACRMRNDLRDQWEQGYFLAETKFKDKPFILTRGKNDKDNAKLYAFCEPIRKRMPITEQVGEIITYKWKEDNMTDE